MPNNPKKSFQFDSSKNKFSGFPKFMSFNNESTTGGRDISDHFAEFFEGVYEQSNRDINDDDVHMMYRLH